MTSLPPLHSIILCGGSGTRLWPLSRKALPKQFVPLIGDKSLLQLTIERLTPLVASGSISCVAAEEHRFLVQETLDAAHVEGPIVLEPVGRNTAPAMAVAALLAHPKDLLLFAPADHHIPDISAFGDTVVRGIPAAQAGFIVTFGIAPSFPSTAYGYIAAGEDLRDGGGGRAVVRFVEKPAAEVARSLLLHGGYYWNAGIFLARAGDLVLALERHAPDILDQCRLAVAAPEEDGRFVRLGKAAFEACRSQSIDHAVLERHDRIAMVPFTGAWSDVGSWNAVAELQSADASGNRLRGHAVGVDANNTFVHAPTRPVVALGTRDLLIIDTADAVLVAHKAHAEQVKDVVALLQSQDRIQATQHRRVPRPWGAYDSVDRGEGFQVKRLTVKPGAKLSLQKHFHRAEHWVVVRGTARVTRDKETFLVRENESAYLPLGCLHRLENPGKTTLEVIEVQSGSYLGEDDIVRFEDTYGRVVPVNVKRQA